MNEPSYEQSEALEGKPVGCPDLEAMHLGIPNKAEQPAKSSPATLGFNSAVIRPETKVNKIKDAGQPLEPLEFPKMDDNTDLIVNACRQVVQSAEDYESETMTTPITVVQACEQLSHLITRVKKVARAKEQREADNAMVEGFEPEQPNLKIFGEIEGLISQVNEKLESIMTNETPITQWNKPRHYKLQALEEIDKFQKTTLHELRKAFE